MSHVPKYVEGYESFQHPLYSTWANMKQRCLNPNDSKFRLYGGRGIRVCERWSKSFAAFVVDMGPRHAICSLDSIDSHGNYEPGNVRWATALEQNRNRPSHNKLTVADAERMRELWRAGSCTQTELARRYGVDPSLVSRLVRGQRWRAQ